MRHSPVTRWLTLWGLLALATLLAPGRLPAPGALVPEEGNPPADARIADARTAVLAPPTHLPPSPYLATSGLVLELPAAETGGSAPRAGSTASTTASKGDPVQHAARSRVRVLELSHDTFAADNLAARAGLLSYRTTAPPPPLI